MKPEFTVHELYERTAKAYTSSTSRVIEPRTKGGYMQAAVVIKDIDKQVQISK